MSEAFPCPRCGAQYGWKAELAGKPVRCKKCGTAFSVPDMSPASVLGLLDDELSQDTGRSSLSGSDSALADDDPPELGRSMTLNNSTRASNPGLLKINWGKYLVCYPWEPLFYLISGVVGVAVGAFTSRFPVSPVASVAICAVAVLGLLGWWAVRRREHFWHGLVCPAVVISTRPYLIAAVSDLSTDEEYHFPAIKIMKQPLGRMTGGPPEIGTRLATVAIFSGDVEAAHWSDFEPLVVNCATSSKLEISRVLRSIGSDEWHLLDYGLKQISDDPRSGDLTFLK